MKNGPRSIIVPTIIAIINILINKSWSQLWLSDNRWAWTIKTHVTCWSCFGGGDSNFFLEERLTSIFGNYANETKIFRKILRKKIGWPQNVRNVSRTVADHKLCPWRGIVFPRIDRRLSRNKHVTRMVTDRMRFPIPEDDLKGWRWNFCGRTEKYSQTP